jgi:uncharacterized membrane protein
VTDRVTDPPGSAGLVVDPCDDAPARTATVPGPPGSEPSAASAAGSESESGSDGAAQRGWTRGHRVTLGAIGAVLFVAYTTYAWARHTKYETTGFDLGIFDQVVRAYAHFEAPTSPLKGVDYNILGDHFHPILVLLVPLYWVWDDPRVLLTAQAALFALSILPVARFTRRRFGPRATLLIVFAYGAGWPLERAVHFDFHEIAFAVPLIGLLIDAMDRRAYRTVVAVCLLLLLVREDMGALVALVGVLVFLRRGRDRTARVRGRVFGAALLGLGVIGYLLATSVIIPAMGNGFTYWTFTALGPDPVSALRTMITQPWRVVWLTLTPTLKAKTLFTIFLPAGFLTLGSPYLVLTLPFLLERMLNDRPLLWETNFHYTSVIAPMLMMGAVDTVHRLVRRFPGALGVRRVWRGRLPIGLVAAFVAWSVGCVAFGLVLQTPDYPVSGLWSGRVWQRNARWHAVEQTLPMIPSGQCVEADNQLAPQLTSRDYVTRVTRSDGLATWAVLDLQMKETGWQSPTPAVALMTLQARGFQVVSWKYPIVLLHSDRPVDPRCARLY